MTNINVTAMNSQQTKELFEFLTSQKDHCHLWKAGTHYHYNASTLTLTHDIVWRKRKDGKDGERFEVITTQEIGKGAQGTVYDIAGTIALDNNQLQFKQDKARVIKCRDHSGGSIADAKQEYDLSKDASHLAIKEPTIVGDKSYTVMKKLPGRELWDIIIEDYDGTRVLTNDERIRLSQALLKALKEQVTDKGIIHRDVKPPNIMVDLNTMTVNILDYGLSTHANNVDDKNAGTPCFAPPEAYLGIKGTVASDVWAMARILALIWRDKITNVVVQGDLFGIAAAAMSVHYNDLFQQIDDLSLSNQKIIKETLNAMSPQEMSNRTTIEEAIAAFDKLIPQLAKEVKIEQAANKSNKSFKEDEVSKQIQVIFTHIQNLRDKAENLNRRGYPGLAIKMNKLAEKLEQETEAFEKLTAEERKVQIHSFTKNCKTELNLVKGDFANNRDTNYLWANLVLAVVGLGFIYLGAACINKAVTGNFLFFSQTKSEKVIEELHDEYSNVLRVAASAA